MRVLTEKESRKLISLGKRFVRIWNDKVEGKEIEFCDFCEQEIYEAGESWEASTHTKECPFGQFIDILKD